MAPRTSSRIRWSGDTRHVIEETRATSREVGARATHRPAAVRPGACAEGVAIAILRASLGGFPQARVNDQLHRSTDRFISTNVTAMKSSPADKHLEVARADRAVDQLAHARPREDRLDEHRAAEQEADLQARDREHGRGRLRDVDEDLPLCSPFARSRSTKSCP